MAVDRPPIVHFPLDACIHGSRVPEYLVTHCTEGGGTIESLGRYFESTPDLLASSFAIEPTGRIGMYVRRLTDKTYHVRDHNSQCLGTELFGWVRLKRAEWLGLPRRRQVYANAWLHAWLCDVLAIPALNAGSAKTGRVFTRGDGLTQHMWVPDNDHDDAGPGYPWDVHDQLVAKWLHTGGPTESTRNLIRTGHRF